MKKSKDEDKSARIHPSINSILKRYEDKVGKYVGTYFMSNGRCELNYFFDIYDPPCKECLVAVQCVVEGLYHDAFYIFHPCEAFIKYYESRVVDSKSIEGFFNANRLD